MQITGELVWKEGIWFIRYLEHFRTVKDSNGVVYDHEMLVKIIPIHTDYIEAWDVSNIGNKYQFKVSYDCPYTFTSRCTMGRCDCDQVATNLVLVDERPNKKIYHTEDMMNHVVYLETNHDIGFKICRKVVEIYTDTTKEVLVKFKESSKYESLERALIWLKTNKGI